MKLLPLFHLISLVLLQVRAEHGDNAADVLAISQCELKDQWKYIDQGSQYWRIAANM